MSTQRTHGDAKAAKPVTKGRPRLGDHALTPRERSARRRAKPKPIKSSEEIYAALVAERNIVSPFHRALATQITNSLVDGDLAEAIKGLSHLPPPVRAEPGSPTHSTSGARERVLQMILNAVEADKQELVRRAERGDELSEADQLRLRLAQIEQPQPDEDEPDDEGDEVASLKAENTELRRLLSGAAPAAAELVSTDTTSPIDGELCSNEQPSPIDPPTSAIIPPSEIAELYREPVYADRLREPVTIDAKPEPAAAKPETEPERGRGDQTRGCRT
jgi:hypothetical protein